VERKQFKGVVEKYSGIWWVVSLFKTGKPSSLGLDNCWKKVPKIGIDSRREKEIAFSTFGEAPIARLGYSLVLGLTDCLVGSSREGAVRSSGRVSSPRL
jgi:hypothetical protein